MQELGLLFLAIQLIVLAIQDFKDRAISWWLIPFTITSYFVYQNSFFTLINTELYLNLLFVLINYISVTAYFSLKEKRIVNIFKDYLGIGDLLFFVVCAFMFSLPNFIFFLIASFLLTLIGALLWSKIKPQSSPYIPLAGIMAALLIPLLMLEFFFQINLFRELHFLTAMQA